MVHSRRQVRRRSGAYRSEAIDLNGASYDHTTKASTSLEVTPKNDFTYASIPASTQMGLEGENSKFLIEIKTPYGSYQVPDNRVR
ncbi:hypothetical protein [Cohnella sp.]|uniref:hypothetical protein n=1 Tax=Cohnella sp. TaxID=1883426 RepID=UPI0037043631